MAGTCTVVDPGTEERCTRTYEHAHCAVCVRAFVAAGDPPPRICGQIGCRARHGWGPEDWAGRVRMARAREAAGVPLNDLDREALRIGGGAR